MARTKEDMRKTEIEKDVRNHVEKELGQKPLISVRELWRTCVGEDKPINWIRSYKTLLKYVTEDYKDVFQATLKGKNSGTRYYLKVDNIVDFLYEFESSKL